MAGGDILISPDIIERFLRKLYDGRFDVSTEIEPTIWREVLRLLNEATVEGLSQSKLPPTLEEDFYSELRHSNEVFAAFKVHSMAVRMADKLLDEDGKLKPFRLWKDEVKGISDHYNGAWLRTEYNTAVIRAHNAADWRQFERNRDIMPNLRWMPTTSPHPEAEHRSFWEKKLTRPIDDPFWNKHRPGDRWNCKCSLEATDEDITPIPEDADKIKPQRGLENNPGKDGQLFSKKHPYFPKNCKECTFNKNKGTITNWFRNEEGDCRSCVNIKSAIEKASIEHDITAIFAKLPNISGAEYIKNVRKITEMKIFKKMEKDIFSAVGDEDKDYNNLIAGAKKAVKAGYKVYVLPNPKGVKSADYIFERNGVVKMYDLKTIKGQSSIGNRLNESIGQTNRVFLNLATNYSTRSMAEEIKKYFETNKDALEVLIAKGNKFVSVDRIFVNDKNYFKKIRILIEK